MLDTGGWFGNIFRSILKCTIILLLIIIVACMLVQLIPRCLKMGCEEMKKATKRITQSEVKQMFLQMEIEKKHKEEFERLATMDV